MVQDGESGDVLAKVPRETIKTTDITVALHPMAHSQRLGDPAAARHMVAVMLIDKTASFPAAHDKALMQDARVLGQRSTVTYVPNANAGRVAASAPAVVEITLTDGERGCPNRVEAVRGTVRNPMSRVEVVESARPHRSRTRREHGAATDRSPSDDPSHH